MKARCAFTNQFIFRYSVTLQKVTITTHFFLFFVLLFFLLIFCFKFFLQLCIIFLFLKSPIIILWMIVFVQFLLLIGEWFFKFMKNRSNHYLNSKSNMNDIICTFFVNWGNIVIYRIFEKLVTSENNWASWISFAKLLCKKYYKFVYIKTMRKK